MENVTIGELQIISKEVYHNEKQAIKTTSVHFFFI